MLKNIASLAVITFKGGLRDRILLGVFLAALLLMLSLPMVSSFSMRDVTGVAISYSLSVISAVGVLLTVILGGSLLAKDIQGRIIHSIATLPISRTQYVLGKYLGLAMTVLCSLIILGLLNCIGIYYISLAFPPDKAIVWQNYAWYLLFDIEKLLLLASVLTLLSSVTTSTFLPMLLTLAVYAIGASTEKVKFFIETAQGEKTVAPAVKVVSQVIYYIFPNLSLFDFKTQFTYSLPLDGRSLYLTFGYGLGYCVVMLFMACRVFDGRDFT